MPQTRPPIALSEVRSALEARLGSAALALMPEATIDPLAFVGLASEDDRDGAPVLRDGVGIITVRGILLQRAWRYGPYIIVDGYDTILERVEAAIEAGAESLFFALDGPGGMCAGCEQAAVELRALLDATGIPSVTYVDELVASALMWIASATDAIFVPPTGRVGSIGTIATGLNLAGMLKNDGVIPIVAASPKGKASLHPYLSVDEEGVKRLNAEIEQLSATFAGWVSARRSLSVDAIMALDAAVFMGNDAIKAGLADGVMGYEAAFQEAVKRKRKSSMGAEQDRRAGAAMLSLLALGGMKLEASVKEAPPEDIERAAAETARLAELGRELEKRSGAKGPAALETVSAWQEGHARVAALESRVKVERLRGRDADKHPPAEKFALNAAGLPDPAAGPHERFASMSLAVFDARLDVALSHPSTCASPAARTGITNVEAKAKSAGLDPAIYQQALENLGIGA